MTKKVTDLELIGAILTHGVDTRHSLFNAVLDSDLQFILSLQFLYNKYIIINDLIKHAKSMIESII